MLQQFIELPVRKTQNHFKANIYYWKFLWISILSISVTRIETWYFDNIRFKQCHFRKYSPKKIHHLFFHILEIALRRIGKDSMHLFIWWKTHYICFLFSGKSNSVAKRTWISEIEFLRNLLWQKRPRFPTSYPLFIILLIHSLSENTRGIQINRCISQGMFLYENVQ